MDNDQNGGISIPEDQSQKLARESPPLSKNNANLHKNMKAKQSKLVISPQQNSIYFEVSF